MQKAEFIKAWNTIDGAPQLAYESVSATLWDAINDIYADDAMNAILAGGDRHIKMARWVKSNADQVKTRADAIASPRLFRREQLNSQIIKLTLERDLLRL